MSKINTPPVTAQLKDDFLNRYDGNTRSAYENDLNAFARFRGEESVAVALSDLLRLSGKEAEKLVDKYKLSIAGAKILTFRRRVSTLRNFCNYAHAQEAIGWMLTANTRVKRTKKQKEKAAPKDMSGPPEKAILDLRRRLIASGTLDALRDVAIIDLHYYRGLRVSELVGLDVSNLDLRGLKIRILGKGREITEELEITEQTAKSIRNWLNVRPGVKGGPLFVRLDAAVKRPSDYTRISRTGLFLKFRRYGKEIGYPLRPHGLRHSSITSMVVRAAKAHVSLTAVQKFARHQSFSTTASYVNKEGAEIRKAMVLLPR